MLFAIDVDGTIAGGPIRWKLYSAHQNEMLQLGITSAVLETLTDYNSFLQSPEVLAFRACNEKRFQESFISCLLSTEILLALEALPDAQVGVSHLARIGTVRYYTKRANQEATKQWLAQKQFPNPDDVVFVNCTMHKLGASHLETENSVVLIDDRFKELSLGVETLLVKRPHVIDDLKQRMLLVAFGRKTAPQHVHGIRSLALPAWNRVEEFIPTLENKVYGMRSL